MKHTLTSLAAIACLGLAGTAAHAADGQIEFKGQLVDTSCTINLSGSAGSSGTVTLPTVSVASLQNSGDKDGTTGFTISLTECTLGDKNKARVYFEPTAGVTVTPEGNLPNTLGGDPGSAQNVQLRLLESDVLTPIVPGDKAGQEGSTFYTNLNPASGGTTVLQYYVQYYAVGKTTPGAVESHAAFSVIYQ